MKKLSLTQGLFSDIDDDDYNWLIDYKWQAHQDGNTYYARHGYKNNRGVISALRMHRLIWEKHFGGIPNGYFIDHIYRNGLNNQKSNLRICTNAQNQWNSQAHADGKFKTRGVCLSAEGKWRARIQINGKRMSLGDFDDIHDAMSAYNNAARECHGEFFRDGDPT